MSRDPRLYLEDIRESCAKILRYTQGMTYETFTHDDKTLDAIIRNLTVIGEAVKRLPAALKQRHPYVEWRKISGLRDIVVHEYFGIDEEILWDIVQNKIPELYQYVGKILTIEDKGKA